MCRYLFAVVLLVWSLGVQALESLRIGSQLLVVGDSAAKVKALMGNPVVRTKGGTGKSPRKSSSKLVGKSKRQQAKEQGERWQYRRDGHTTIFTIANGKIVHIEDMPR
jgi:hypothetical protein